MTTIVAQLMLRSVAGKNRFSDVIAWVFSENNRNEFVPQTLYQNSVLFNILLIYVNYPLRPRSQIQSDWSRHWANCKRKFNMAAILIWNKMFSAFLIGHYKFYVLLSGRPTLNSSGIISKTAGCQSIEGRLITYFLLAIWNYLNLCYQVEPSENWAPGTPDRLRNQSGIYGFSSESVMGLLTRLMDLELSQWNEI